MVYFWFNRLTPFLGVASFLESSGPLEALEKEEVKRCRLFAYADVEGFLDPFRFLVYAPVPFQTGCHLGLDRFSGKRPGYFFGQLRKSYIGQRQNKC